jgi:transglutaminase-like putative cysteine protease
VRFEIRYRCSFEYDELVRESQNELRAAPTSDDRQSLISYRVTTTPSARVFSFEDYWGTRVDTFGVREPHILLEVVAEAWVETRSTPLAAASPRLELLTDAAFRDAHLEYLDRTRHTAWQDAIAAEAEKQVSLMGDVVSAVLAIHRRVHTSMSYVPGATSVGMGVEDVFRRGQGVCQDYAHLAVAMCRSVGIPARYVSGYLFTADDAKGGDVARDQVHVQTHAWFEAAVPGMGWLGLDPTNSQAVGPRHVKIGHGRDYDDVPPLRGMYSGRPSATLSVGVDIRRTSSLHPQQAQQQQQ